MCLQRKECPTEITTFKDMYVADLQELVSVEDHLADALLTMSEMASHPALKSALMGHRENTLAQQERLISILQDHGADPHAHTDQAMQALVRETEKMLSILKGQGPPRRGAHRLRAEA